MAKYRDQLIEAVMVHPFKDVVYTLPLSKVECGLSSTYPAPGNVACGNWCIAGSYAVSTIMNTETMKKLCPLVAPTLDDRVDRQWKASDVDIFILGAKKPARVPPINGLGLDLVHVVDETIEDLLLNFDLPCCRAAIDAEYNWHVSAHCLAAMITEEYFMPSYLQHENALRALIGQQHLASTCTESKREGAIKWLFSRLEDRIDKYRRRGYRPVWRNTQVIVQWLTNRFHYAEWDLE